MKVYCKSVSLTKFHEAYKHYYYYDYYYLQFTYNKTSASMGQLVSGEAALLHFLSIDTYCHLCSYKKLRDYLVGLIDMLSLHN